MRPKSSAEISEADSAVTMEQGSSSVQPILIEPDLPDGSVSLLQGNNRVAEDVIASVPNDEPGSLYQLVDVNVNGVVKSLQVPLSLPPSRKSPAKAVQQPSIKISEAVTLQQQSSLSGNNSQAQSIYSVISSASFSKTVTSHHGHLVVSNNVPKLPTRQVQVILRPTTATSVANPPTVNRDGHIVVPNVVSKHYSFPNIISQTRPANTVQVRQIFGNRALQQNRFATMSNNSGSSVSIASIVPPKANEGRNFLHQTGASVNNVCVRPETSLLSYTNAGSANAAPKFQTLNRHMIAKGVTVASSKESSSIPNHSPTNAPGKNLLAPSNSTANNVKVVYQHPANANNKDNKNQQQGASFQRPNFAKDCNLPVLIENNPLSRASNMTASTDQVAQLVEQYSVQSSQNSQINLSKERHIATNLIPTIKTNSVGEEHRIKKIPVSPKTYRSLKELQQLGATHTVVKNEIVALSDIVMEQVVLPSESKIIITDASGDNQQLKIQTSTSANLLQSNNVNGPAPFKNLVQKYPRRTLVLNSAVNSSASGSAQIVLPPTNNAVNSIVNVINTTRNDTKIASTASKLGSHIVQLSGSNPIIKKTITINSKQRVMPAKKSTKSLGNTKQTLLIEQAMVNSSTTSKINTLSENVSNSHNMKQEADTDSFQIRPVFTLDKTNKGTLPDAIAVLNENTPAPHGTILIPASPIQVGKPISVSPAVGKATQTSSSSTTSTPVAGGLDLAQVNQVCSIRQLLTSGAPDPVFWTLQKPNQPGNHKVPQNTARYVERPQSSETGNPMNIQTNQAQNRTGMVATSHMYSSKSYLNKQQHRFRSSSSLAVKVRPPAFSQRYPSLPSGSRPALRSPMGSFKSPTSAQHAPRGTTVEAASSEEQNTLAAIISRLFAQQITANAGSDFGIIAPEFTGDDDLFIQEYTTDVLHDDTLSNDTVIDLQAALLKHVKTEQPDDIENSITSQKENSHILDQTLMDSDYVCKLPTGADSNRMDRFDDGENNLCEDRLIKSENPKEYDKSLECGSETESASDSESPLFEHFKLKQEKLCDSHLKISNVRTNLAKLTADNSETDSASGEEDTGFDQVEMKKEKTGIETSSDEKNNIFDNHSDKLNVEKTKICDNHVEQKDNKDNDTVVCGSNEGESNENVMEDMFAKLSAYHENILHSKANTQPGNQNVSENTEISAKGKNLQYRKLSDRLKQKKIKLGERGSHENCRCLGCEAAPSASQDQKLRKLLQRYLKRKERNLWKKYKKTFPMLKAFTLSLPKLKGLQNRKSLDLSKYEVVGQKIIPKRPNSSKRQLVTVTGVDSPLARGGNLKDKYLMIKSSRGTFLVPIDGNRKKPVLVVSNAAPMHQNLGNSMVPVRAISNWLPPNMNEVNLKEVFQKAAELNRAKSPPMSPTSSLLKIYQSPEQIIPNTHLSARMNVGDSGTSPLCTQNAPIGTIHSMLSSKRRLMSPTGSDVITKRSKPAVAAMLEDQIERSMNEMEQRTRELEANLIASQQSGRKASSSDRIKALRQKLLESQQAMDKTRGVLEKSKDLLKELAVEKP